MRFQFVKFFCPKIWSCEFFDKFQVCPPILLRKNSTKNSHFWSKNDNIHHCICSHINLFKLVWVYLLQCCYIPSTYSSCHLYDTCIVFIDVLLKYLASVAGLQHKGKAVLLLVLQDRVEHLVTFCPYWQNWQVHIIGKIGNI